MKTLVIINMKGGVAKTTTAATLGQGLQAQGYRVLYVDMDAQGSLTDTLLAEAPGDIPTSMGLLDRTASAKECIIQTPSGDLITASPKLAEADISITAIGKEYRLRDALKPISGLYDFVIIDTPPHLGIATVNALTAATDVIIPTEAAPYSLKCIGQLQDTLQAIKEYCNPGLTIQGILITRYNSRAVISRDMAEILDQMADSMETTVYNTKIRECTALKEAAIMKRPIFAYAPRSNASVEYMAFTKEVIERSQNHA